MNYDSLDNLLEQGHHQLERGQYEPSLEIFEQADSLFPNNPQIKYGLGLAHYWQEQYQKSVLYFNSALLLCPGNMIFLARRSLSYSRLNLTSSYIADFNFVLQSEARTNEDWRAKGLVFTELNKLKEALGCYHKSLKLNIDDHQSWHNKGRVLSSLGNYQEALSCYLKALLIFPEKQSSWRCCGTTWFFLEQYSDALKNYSKALKLNPDDYSSHFGSGLCLMKQKKYSKAIASYNRALEINPNDFITWYYQGLSHFCLNQYKEAKLSLDKALEINPNYQLAKNEKAKLQRIANLNAKKSPIKYYLKALRIYTEKDCPEGWATFQLKLADAYKDRNEGDRVGNIKRTIFHYKNALNIFTESTFPEKWAEVQFALADIYETAISRSIKIRRDREEDIELIIEHYKNVLRVHTEENYSDEWAETQNRLAFNYKVRQKGDKKENINQAVERYISVLRVYTKASYPICWASIQQSLANVFMYGAGESNIKNEERAIFHYENALKIYTEFDYPKEWVEIQSELAFAYRYRIQGNKEKNLEQAILFYNNVLRIYTKSNYPKEWAKTQSDLAFAYFYKTEENEAENIEQTIEHYQNALKIYTIEDCPDEWAKIQSELAFTYRYRIQGNKEKNLEQAILFYNNVLRIYTKSNYPKEWAKTQRNLAFTHFYKTEENEAENIEQTIEYYQNALKIYTTEDYPDEWAKIQSELAFTYRYRIQGNKEKNLKQAIKLYKNALQIYLKSTFPEEHSRIREELADIINVYECNEKETENNENINSLINSEEVEENILYYENVLKTYKENEHSVYWADIQCKLASAYRYRVNGRLAENTESSIRYYENALQFYTEDSFPEKWADIHNNLALAYLKRIKGERVKNIDQAIKLIEKALHIYTDAKYPIIRAKTQILLGIAYLERSRPEEIVSRKTNDIYSDVALHIFNDVLQIFTENEYPKQWADIQLNIANLYYQKVSPVKFNIVDIYKKQTNKNVTTVKEHHYEKVSTDIQFSLSHTNKRKVGIKKEEDIEIAITYYRNALKIYNQKDYPNEWAVTQNHLGNAYYERIRGVKSDNLEWAIACYKIALKIYNRKEYPNEWAITQNNLGNAYYERVRGVKSDNLKQMVKYYQKSLSFFTPNNNPIKCLSISHNLGNLLFAQNNWESAIYAYSMAIEAVEQNREWIEEVDKKHQIISNAIEVYRNIIQSFIYLGKIDKAIEYVERGKARNLVDLLGNQNLHLPKNIPAKIIDHFNDLRKKIIIEERNIKQQNELRNIYRKLNLQPNNFTFLDGFKSEIFQLPERMQEQLEEYAVEQEHKSQINILNVFDYFKYIKNSYGIDFFDEKYNKVPNLNYLNNLRQELDDLVKEHIQAVDPSFQITQKVEPISFEEIRKVLPTEQTVLIELFIGNSTLSAFIVTRQQEVPVHLEYTQEQFQSLVDLADRYYGLYRQRDRRWHNLLPDLLIQLAQNLQLEIIIDRIRKLVPDCNQLILVPHRWLHLLPIHALPLDNDQCLLDLFPQGVSFAPSVQLLKLSSKQSKPALKSLFAIQNPTEDLNFTNIEVQAIRSQFKPNDDVLEKDRATKSALTPEKLAQTHIAHFSCHGYFNFENPELSALLMAGSKVDKGEGDKANKKEKGENIRFLPSRDGGNIDLEQCLTLGEIFSLDLRNCCLVTLSACETGVTDFKSLSDEYIGLPSGFLYAGSPSVVSSLWTVNDLSTSFLMIKFYQNLQKIDSVAIALNQAQLWLRDLTKEELAEWKTMLDIGWQMYKVDQLLIDMPDNSRPFASPYHWAAFCAVGS